MIGVFVVLSLVLFMTAVVIFGGNKFFAQEKLIIAYFDGSLSGLSVGAPVTYRGVTIGQVKAIKIQIEGNGNRSQEISIPIIIALSPEATMIVEEKKERNNNDIYDFMDAMCKQGLRAKLKLQSLVTGKRYVDLAFYENSPAVYRDKNKEYFEIPTLPSDMQQFSKMMEDVDVGKLYKKFMHTLNSLDTLVTTLAESIDREKIKQLLDNLAASTVNLQSILAKLDSGVPPILTQADNTLAHITVLTRHADELVQSLDNEVVPGLHTELKRSFEQLNLTLQQANQLLSQAEKTISPYSPLYYRFTESMKQLEETARSIEKLSDFIHRNPETLIFGLQNPGRLEKE